MANKKLSELSREELEKKLNDSKTVFKGLAIIYGLLVIAAIVFFFTAENDPNMLPMVSILVLMVASLLPGFSSRKAIEKELESR